MKHDYRPHLKEWRIADLRPTQVTVGFREVERKREEWRARGHVGKSDYLGRHMLPAVIGPKAVPWIVDHHHLALALHREGAETVLISPIADLSDLEADEFLTFMDNRNWLHPFDAKGRRVGLDDLPKKVADLVDDPFRSLAGSLREAGGYAKDATPYSEFLWADFLRRRIGAKALAEDAAAALKTARELAHSEAAAHLPGWTAPQG